VEAFVPLEAMVGVFVADVLRESLVHQQILYRQNHRTSLYLAVIGRCPIVLAAGGNSARLLPANSVHL
jgi:hypothetical protein